MYAPPEPTLIGGVCCTASAVSLSMLIVARCRCQHCDQRVRHVPESRSNRYWLDGVVTRSLFLTGSSGDRQCRSLHECSMK